jgi:uncharacterized protein (TIGR00288 family)
MERETKNLAVFIDYENCHKAKDFDLSVLMTRLKERGRLLIKRAYGDWGRFAKDKKQLAKASFSLTELPSHGDRGKNSSDIALVVDALEATMNRTHIDTVVVVSGDSDFTPLYTKVRELGMRVIVVGPKQGTSDWVKDYCDELLYFHALAGKTKNDKGRVSESWDTLRSAIRATNNEGRLAYAGTLKSRMKQVDASFDESNYGFGKFTKYLVKAERDGIICITRNGSSEWIVNDADGDEPTLDDVHATPKPAHQPKALLLEPEEIPEPPPTQRELLEAALRKARIPYLGVDIQREAVVRICKVAAETSYPVPRNKLWNAAFDNFADWLEEGAISKTRIRSLIELLERSGAFASSHIEGAPENHYELTLTLIPGDHRSMMEAHDGMLRAIAEELGLELEEEDWSGLLVTPPQAMQLAGK